MKNEDPSSFINKLAALFRKKGDDATADALDGRPRTAAAHAEDSTDQEALARRLINKATAWDNEGRHEKAEPLLVRALAICTAILGPDHLDTQNCLNSLASCRYSNGDFTTALQDYRRLRISLMQTVGSADILTRITTQNIGNCRKCLRNSIGARHLQEHVTRVLRDAHDSAHAVYTARLNTVINSLIERRRYARAVPLLERWLALQRRDASAGDRPSPLGIWRYARILRLAGDLNRAEVAFRQLVVARNCQAGQTGDTTRLASSLSEWGRCLTELGAHRDAAETLRLAEQIGQTADPDSASSEERSKRVSPADLIIPVILRISFMLGLTWQSGARPFELVKEAGQQMLRDQFRFDDKDDYWIDFEMDAPVEMEPSCPCLNVAIRFPWDFTEPSVVPEVLSLVNEMNLAGCCCAVSVERESGRIAIQSNIVFTGYHDKPGIDGEFSVPQTEATLNLLAQALGVAHGWRESLRQFAATPGMTASELLAARKQAMADVAVRRQA